MKKLLLLAALLLPIPAAADPFVFQPTVGGSGGVGSVTSVSPGEGNSTSAGTCGSGAITTTGTLTHCQSIREVTAATDTLTSADCAKKVVGNRATAITMTLPGAAGITGCTIDVASIGVGNITFSGSIDGVAARVMQRYAGVKITSDGSAWRSSGVAPGVAADGLVDPDQLPVATTAALGGVKSGTCITMDGTGNKFASVSAECRTLAIAFIIDGGGSAITTGIKGDLDIPASCTITGAKVRLDQSGSIVVDVWKLAFSTSASPTVANTITASAKPTVSSTIASTNTTLTGWTTSVVAGDVLRFNVDSITTATRATLTLTCVKS